MTSSSKAELLVTYVHDPRTMGYTRVTADLVNSVGRRQVYWWGEEAGTMSRSQLVVTVTALVKNHAPEIVGFRGAVDAVADEAPFVYWSRETTQGVVDGSLTPTDLSVG